jgi:hypothetical protein
MAFPELFWLAPHRANRETVKSGQIRWPGIQFAPPKKSFTSWFMMVYGL